MKDEHLSKLFVFLVFIVVATVIVKNLSITGNAANGVPIDALKLEKMGEFSAKNYYFDMSSDFNLEVSGLKAGNVLYAVNSENKYELLVLRVHENYEFGDSHLSLSVNPGDKRFILKEGEQSHIDFNNDDLVDAKISVISISGSSVKLTLSKP